MNRLCIDWGNTLVKAAVYNPEGKALELRDFSAEDAATNLTELLDQYQPAAAILASVVNETAEVTALLSERTHLVTLNSHTPLPIINAYHSAVDVGPDRIAAAVAIQSMYPNQNNLAICIGTCITYNFVASNNAFRGGAISPGMRMRLQAMHQYTDKLPEVKAEGDLLLLGYDTETGMRSGAVYGAGAEIHGMIQAYGSQYADFNAVLTGGDAAFFARQLKSKIFADPELILKGLHLILKHNVPSLR